MNHGFGGLIQLFSFKKYHDYCKFAIVLPRSNDYVYICLYVNIEIKTFSPESKIQIFDSPYMIFARNFDACLG